MGSGQKSLSKKAVRDDRVDSINKEYKAGLKSLEGCEELIRAVVEEFRKADAAKLPQKSFNSENIEIVERYYEEVYRRKKIKDSSKKSMRYDLFRAVGLLGDKSLRVASQNEIQDLVDKNSKNVRQQRRAVSRLRQLLLFIERPNIRLEMEPDEDLWVKFLTLNELELLMNEFSEDEGLRSLIEIAGKTGLRQSEIFGLTKKSVKGSNSSILYVGTQLLPIGKRCLPKNKKARNTFVLPGAISAVHSWLSISPSKRESYRAKKNNLPDAVKKACKKLFPDNPEKHLNFRDLRHIMGVHLAEKGVPTELIAKSMGHSVEVCKKHYSGFMIHDDGIEMIKKFIG